MHIAVLHTAVEIVALFSLAAWIYLLAGRGGFWLASVRDEADRPAPPGVWPRVVAIVPARNEAETIGPCIRSLLLQDYPGAFSIVLVDDESQDGTAEIALNAAAACKSMDRLVVLRGQTLPNGWTGKLWAVKQGVEHALQRKPDYLLLTDADITHAPRSLANLVARAQAGGYVLTSLMAKLRCESLAERCFVPAFIFFFQMLYPLAWVNRPTRRTAAAAGGCMLVRPQALSAAGGIEAIRGALIDDCALAAALKPHGPIWLGLTEQVRSIRAYHHIGDIRRMVARSAYAQLRYSPALLAATVGGMAFTYLAPPALTLLASGRAQIVAALGWALMALAFQPILRAYRLSPLWGLALPIVTLGYMVFTLDSAYQHWRGRGGLWKGRVQANVAERA